MARFIGILFLITVFSCDVQKKSGEDPLVAEINGTNLYMSQLNVPYFQNKSDSIKYINTKAEEWMRTEILLAEANKEIKMDPHIEHLVDDYRKNLLLAKFEKKYIETHLDTAVSKQEIQSFLEKHELPFSSKGPQIKCSFGKVKSSAENLEKLDEWWKDQKMEEIRSYCTKFAEISILENAKWKSLDEIKKYIPESVFKKSNYSKKGYYQKSHKDYEYFLFVNEYEKESTELNAVDTEKIKKLILHNRQLQLLKKYKEELYSSTINEKQIKFYFN